MYTFSSILALSLISAQLAAPIDVVSIGVALANGSGVVKAVNSSNSTLKAIISAEKLFNISSVVPLGVASAANAPISPSVTISPPSIVGATININPPTVGAQTIGGAPSGSLPSTISTSKSMTPIISVIYNGGLPQGPAVSASSVSAFTKPLSSLYSVQDPPSVSTTKVPFFSVPTGSPNAILTLLSIDKRPITIVSAPSYTMPTASSIPPFLSAGVASAFLAPYTSAPSGSKVTTQSSPSISTFSTDKWITRVDAPAFSAPSMPAYTPSTYSSFSSLSGPPLSSVSSPDARLFSASAPTPSSVPYFNIPASMLSKGDLATTIKAPEFSSPSIPTYTVSKPITFTPSGSSLSSPDARLFSASAPTPSSVPYFNIPASMLSKGDLATTIKAPEFSSPLIPTPTASKGFTFTPSGSSLSPPDVGFLTASTPSMSTYTPSSISSFSAPSGPSITPSAATGILSFSAPSKLPISSFSSPSVSAPSTADKRITTVGPIISAPAAPTKTSSSIPSIYSPSNTVTQGSPRPTPSMMTIIRSSTFDSIPSPSATPLVVAANVAATAQASKTITIL